ncbi:TlpA family protein disulfide reductase [Natronorubrum sp. FCH18a]|uniref:TlpA family protein disulfide reductase n=1 Tax=Natronorubrum sp. FCH18a TaxID=3447018 RepID=UPI003F511A8E
MRRRSFIAATPSVAVLSGCLDDSGSGSNGDEDAATERDEPPFDVTTVDAPGSDAGTVTVPAADQIQLINFTRTTCPTSRAFLERVGEAEERLEESVDVGPDGTVHVLSVIDGSAGAQPSEAELADWWAEQDGDWTIGMDESGALVDHYEISSYPTTVAIDGDGDVHWRDEGGTTASNVVRGVETALEAAAESETRDESSG